ncbi:MULTISPECIES: hypothetical protein [Halobacteriovorax]|uniref:hypothetical protein n=1 Tax=Halobacteriovorax TaxID=1652133 RepID=UPI001314C9FF|nr:MULTISPECIES: hypothetical protein [Halobacteriovorax]
MEFLEIILLIMSAYYIWRRPQFQKRAENLLIGATFIMFFVWFVATKHMILPPGNY